MSTGNSLSYLKVVLATEKATGTQFAVKKMLKVHLSKENNKKFVMNERNVLSQCDHPNIVRLFKAFRDDDYFCMFLRPLIFILTVLDYVLNLAPHGELLGQIRKVYYFTFGLTAAEQRLTLGLCEVLGC